MKLLMLYCPRFAFATHERSLPQAPEDARSESHTDCVVVLIHAEPSDSGDLPGVETKLVKNAKWLAGKFGSRRVVLHFFSHLGSETAEPEMACGVVARAAERLRASGYETAVTPFGYFCSLQFTVAGPSLAKVFKEF